MVTSLPCLAAPPTIFIVHQVGLGDRETFVAVELLSARYRLEPVGEMLDDGSGGWPRPVVEVLAPGDQGRDGGREELDNLESASDEGPGEGAEALDILDYAVPFRP